jgi:NitT/TauT family transport system permease protein/sulfonate transport system permease protein
MQIGGATILGHVGYSLRRVLIAFLLAVVIGLPLGLFMGWNRVCEKIVMPIFEVLRPIPPIAWIPIAILWLGVAEGSKIFICFVGAFVIMILNSYTGMRYVDPLLITAARAFGATRTQQFFNVAVPACLPSIFAGVQNSLSMSWMCVLAAEMIGGREGVGFLIIQGMDLNRIPTILVGMILIGIVGSLLAALLRWLERLLCPWRRELV